MYDRMVFEDWLWTSLCKGPDNIFNMLSVSPYILFSKEIKSPSGRRVFVKQGFYSCISDQLI